MRPSSARATRRPLSWAALFLALVAVDRAPAQDPERPSVKDEERRNLEEMKQIVQRFQVAVIGDQGKETPATAVPEPLHRWTDPTRPFSGGALWAWRSSGRPIAIIGIELYGSWSLEFVSLSTGRIRADDGAGTHWNPSKGGIAFREIPEAPAPASNEAGRLRQIRDLARGFTARESWDQRDHALRLLPHPIDRYADPASGLVDGAIFIYANGTNPEVLVMIEARQQGDAPPKWFFAAAPLGKADLHLNIGPREVWNCPDDPEHHPTPDEPYYIEHKPRRGPGG
jgi:hypothetical protein